MTDSAVENLDGYIVVSVQPAAKKRVWFLLINFEINFEIVLPSREGERREEAGGVSGSITESFSRFLLRFHYQFEELRGKEIGEDGG